MSNGTHVASDRAIIGRLLGEARPHRLHIAGLLLLSLLSTPLALLAPLPLKIAVDGVIGADPLPGFLAAVLPEAVSGSSTALLLFAATLMLAVAALEQIRSLVSSVLRTLTAERLTLGFRSRLFRHAQRLSLTYHDTSGSADSIYRIFYDASALQYVAVNGIIPLVSAILTFGAMLYVITRIDARLAVVALAVSPILFMIGRRSRLGLRRQSREVKKIDSASMSIVQEVLSAIRVVKAFGQEDHEHQRFIKRSREGLRARMRLAFAEGNLGLLLNLTTAVGGATVLFMGVRHVQAGVVTLGELLIVMSYLSRLYDPLHTMSRKIASLQSHLASAERAFAILDEAPDVPEKPHATPLERARGAVTFEQVSFGYDGDRHVLHEISFMIDPGSRLGIAGHTGAGKTTMLSLLTRFFDPESGRILLDGVDLKDYQLADLRNQFAIVLQDTVLFSTSIAENIAYARPGCDIADIERAARAAHAHEFIDALPDGYDTTVGERGMSLSGGERQRIALARAFLKDAPILILDEPTSSVDVKTEASIIEAMERLMAGRTTFLISHRLSALEGCHKILVLEGGRVVTTERDSAAVRRNLMATSQLKKIGGGATLEEASGNAR